MEPYTVTVILIAEIGSLVCDPARVAMLQALMDGRSLTAAELARLASVTPQTASGHLAQMAAAGRWSFQSKDVTITIVSPTLMWPSRSKHS